MSNIKVSIIIPVYNVAPYIQACMQSVKQQSYRNIEVIFVDDCGADNSISIIADFISINNLSDWQILHHDHNRGLSAARNTGLDAATGDYVYFLDSDDYITPDCIERLVAPLAAQQVDVVIGSYNLIENETIRPQILPNTVLQTNESLMASYAAGEWYVMAWNKLCRRGFLLHNNLFFKEGLIHEDVLWTFQVACKAQSLYMCDAITYNYYVRGASIMTSMSIEKDLLIYLDVFDEIVDYVKQQGRELGVNEYCIIEGKKSGIVYSLMFNNEYELYKMAYSRMRSQNYILPIRAWRRGVINISYLIRDFHYHLPESLGRIYRQLFYLLYYKLRHRKIEGLIWR